ncbi:hypothetical protein ASG11_17815 [Sphingomonas sp. Leaf357]|uniref:hypothetical protein n=1 Tax=Sphingomonas sp. Leaf357 TaxID=1736350 RepID=UPI0006FA2F44|nr:hypothetical protein [Sphingomonas sp. Leaf357]KQS01511.1 hypothetical protein ASG11_17815 [Sphingomonas sp. Leaf357]
MNLGFGLGLAPALRPLAITAPSLPAATFTASQLPSSKRIYQRSTNTGGSQGKGAGTIPVSVNVTQVGTPRFRIRSSDGTTILQAATALAPFTATGAQTLNVPVDARLGWFYIDLSGDGTTWMNGTVQVGMGALLLLSGQSLACRMLVAASDNISMTAAGVTPDPNSTTYVIPGDGNNQATTAAWRPWDANTAGNVGGEVINSAGGAQLAKSMIAQLGVNVGIVGKPAGGTPIVYHTMAQTNGPLICQIIQDVGGFELAFLMIGHSNAQSLTTGGIGARDFKGGLSAFFQMITAANSRSTSYRSVVWAIPNETSGSWGTTQQQNEVRRAMYEFARSTTASALMTSCRYVNSYSLTLSADGTHEGQAGAIQIANAVSTAFSTGTDSPAGDDTLTPTPNSVGTPTSTTFGTAGKFQTACLDGGYVVTQYPYPQGGVGSVGFWYRGTPAGNSVAFSWGNQYLQEAGGRWKWNNSGTETTATTGPLTGTDSTTWHYLSIDRVFADPNGSGGRLQVFQDGVMILNLAAAQAGTAAVAGSSAIRTFSGSLGNFGINVPVSDWRGYSKAMGNYVPTTALTGAEPFLFVGFPLNGNSTSVA